MLDTVVRDADKAGVCLRAIRQVREGRGDAAAVLLREVPELASTCEDGRVDQSALLARFAAHLETAALRQIREMEASSCRVRRRQVQLEALCTSGSRLFDDPSDVGAALCAEWAPVFTARRTSEEEMSEFGDYLVKVVAIGEWDWPWGQLSGVAGKHGRSAPGPDGAPYQVRELGEQETLWRYFHSSSRHRSIMRTRCARHAHLPSSGPSH